MSKQMDVIIHIKHLVGRATNDNLSSPDIAANTAVVDFINMQQDGFIMQHVLKAIKRRFRTSDMRIQLLALNLLDACVSNCGPIFHERLAGAELWRDMQEASVNTKKYSLAVQQKVLELIQAWAIELQPQTFREVFRRLQKKKVRFPPPDRQRAPVAAAPPPMMGGVRPMAPFSTNMGGPPHASFTAPMMGTFGGAPGSTLPQRPRPSSRAAAREEVVQAKQTAVFLEELLKEIEENDPAGITQEHVYDLAQQCLAFKFSMNDLASFETDETLLADAIGAHEELDKVVGKYTDMLSYSPSAAPERGENGTSGGITNGTTTTTAAVAAAGGSGSTPVSPISSAATPAAAANNPSNLIDELLSLDMTDPPAPVGAPLGGGGGSVDPFAHSGSLDGLPLQPPGPIQPGGFHDHGGFGTNAFGGGAAAAAPPVAPAASVMPPSSGNPFADEPPPAFASSMPPPPTGAYATSPSYATTTSPSFTNGTAAPPPAFAAPSYNAASQPPPMFPMAGAQPVPQAPSHVPPVAAGPPHVPKDAFDEIVTARVTQQQQQQGGFGSSPSFAAHQGGFGGAPSIAQQAPSVAQQAPSIAQQPSYAPQPASVYPALYGTQAPPAANPFGGPAPAWGAPPAAAPTMQPTVMQPPTVAQQPGTPDPFDSLVTLR